MSTFYFFVTYLCLLLLPFSSSSPNDDDTIVNDITIDDTTTGGRIFDGIGALSAGASSALLFSYPPSIRSTILDYLFLPGFGASLSVLKVEIGGDGQSTDGTEPSHAHTLDEFNNRQNFNRGYEFWIMKEAKARNPSIILSALSWAFPGWLSASSPSSPSPYANRTLTALYTVSWLLGARSEHALEIDWVGVWNERGYDVDYILELRKQLDAHNLTNVKISAADDFGFDICTSLSSSPALSAAVSSIGVHYPGTTSSELCQSLTDAVDDDGSYDNSGNNSDTVKTKSKSKSESTSTSNSNSIKLWSSEDYSTATLDGEGDDSTQYDLAAGCWARILNQNYVNGYYTSTIAWALISSWYRDLPFSLSGLMVADSPWSGWYSVSAPIWVTAHTTQFVSPGWRYLSHGSGVGLLSGGGSYVSFTSSSSASDDDDDDDAPPLTIVIETMSHDHSPCIRPGLPPYNSSETQILSFTLAGNFAKSLSGPVLHLWRSNLNPDSGEDGLFEYLGLVNVTDSSFSLTVSVDCIYTVSTSVGQHKGSSTVPPPPSRTPFPSSYIDLFDDATYEVDGKAKYFADQTGSWQIASCHPRELRQEKEEGEGEAKQDVVKQAKKLNVNGVVDVDDDDDDADADVNLCLRQEVTAPVIGWATDAINAISIIGDEWTNYEASVDVYIEPLSASSLSSLSSSSSSLSSSSSSSLLSSFSSSGGLGVRVGVTGQYVATAVGLFIWIRRTDTDTTANNTNMNMNLTTNADTLGVNIVSAWSWLISSDIAMSNVLVNGTLSVDGDKWHNVHLIVKDTQLTGIIDNEIVANIALDSSLGITKGVTAIVSELTNVQHDNFMLKQNA